MNEPIPSPVVMAGIAAWRRCVYRHEEPPQIVIKVYDAMRKKQRKLDAVR